LSVPDACGVSPAADQQRFDDAIDVEIFRL
jgi:hypothetical protein